MSNVPGYLVESRKVTTVCLILEGYEEWYYFRRLNEIAVFSRVYAITLINAKSATSIPAKFQEAYSSNSYDLVLVVCDYDRVPNAFNQVVAGLNTFLGPNKASVILTFTRPCTLQVILLHFGSANLTTQSKLAAQGIVEELTGVANYDAHKDQLESIAGKIYHRSWQPMSARLELLSTDCNVIPSTNILILFRNLCSDGSKWILNINKSLEQ